MELEGYKIVRELKSGNLWSCIRKKGKGGRQYKENEWIEPKEGDGPLTVFDTFGDAVNFLGTSKTKYIYRCLYKGTNLSSLWYESNYTRRSNVGIYPLSLPVFPMGTMFASAVKLTKRVR